MLFGLAAPRDVDSTFPGRKYLPLGVQHADTCEAIRGRTRSVGFSRKERFKLHALVFDMCRSAICQCGVQSLSLASSGLRRHPMTCTPMAYWSRLVSPCRSCISEVALFRRVGLRKSRIFCTQIRVFNYNSLEKAHEFEAR